jgi:signal transduction histidine kinase
LPEKARVVRGYEVGRAGFWPLVGNALKFTEVGEVRIQVTAADGMFAVTVANAGPGIAEAEQQKIFEEFQQAESVTTRTQGGTGLGLAIAKKIVELHGGQIGGRVAPGAGFDLLVHSTLVRGAATGGGMNQTSSCGCA